MRKTTPTLMFASITLALAGYAQAQAPSNNPANNPSRNITMQPGSNAVTPQALAGKDGTSIKPNPSNRFVRIRNFVEVQPGVYAEVFLDDPNVAIATPGPTTPGATAAAPVTPAPAATATYITSAELAALTDTEVRILTPELDKAIARQKLRDQKKVAINGQLWTMIVPRTNVDRTNQMRDDPPSPLLNR